METAELISRLLDVIEKDIAPVTAKGVARGNKLCGAAILKKSDIAVIVAETNNEIENPLWHGEMATIKKLEDINLDVLKKLVKLSVEKFLTSSISPSQLTSSNLYSIKGTALTIHTISPSISLLSQLLKFEANEYLL